MPTCTTRVQLDQDPKSLSCGDTLSGKLYIQVEKRSSVKRFKACFVHRTTGFGKPKSQVVDVLHEVRSGDWLEGETVVEFSFTIPVAAPSYVGTHVSHEWAFEIDGQIAYTVFEVVAPELTIRRSPDTTSTERLRDEQTVSSKVGCSLLGMLALVLFALLSLSCAVGTNGASQMVFYIALGIGALCTAGVVYRRMSSSDLRDLGSSRLYLIGPLLRGRSQRVRIEFDSFVPTADMSVVVLLEAKERAVRVQGTNRIVRHHIAYQDRIRVPITGSPTDVAFREEVDITLPESVPPSFDLGHHSVTWTVTVGVEKGKHTATGPNLQPLVC